MTELSEETIDFLQTRTAEELLRWVGYVAGSNFYLRATAALDLCNEQAKAAADLSDDTSLVEYSLAAGVINEKLKLHCLVHTP
jgi:hypothetical protein